MTTPGPLVSAIVPNYNYGRALELCLRALQRQTYPHVEIILVDDHSTDDSVAVARRLGVRVVSPSVNGGVSVARNLGAAHARGDILFFVDSDVALDPDAIAVAVDTLAGDPRIGAVCGTYHREPLIRDSLIEEYRAFHQYYWLGACAGRIHDFVHPALLAVRAAAFAEIGGFNPRLRRTEGAEFGRRLCARHQAWLNPAIRGRHDNDDTLRVVLRKVFIRTRMQFSFFRRGQKVGRVAGSSPARGALLAALAVPAALVPVLAGPLWSVLPVALVAGSLASDARMYRTAVAERGLAFGAYFAAMHFLVNLTIMAGVAAGALQWHTSPTFRALYDPPTGTRGGAVTGAAR